MGDTLFVTRQVIPNNQVAHMVFDRQTNRCLGGFGCTFYRAYVYPMYTPKGQGVLQEAPCDHPFHTGLFVAQGPVEVGQREANFWVMPPTRRHGDPLWDHVGRMDCLEPPEIALHDRGARFDIGITWRDDHEEPMLDERRILDLRIVSDATVCDVTSQFTAAYGAVDFPQSKHGGLGIRVEPRLLPFCGGDIIGAGNRRGGAEELHGGDSDFVAYENEVTGVGRYGVLLSITEAGVRGPWFVREYGLALYCPTLHKSLRIADGRSLTLSLRVVAYDGTLTEERAAEWL